MIKYLLFFLFVGYSNYSYAQLLVFDKVQHDFFTVKKGEKVTAIFTFKNLSERDVIIGQVHTSCGCTAVNYTRGSIKPEQSGEIKVIYDTSEHNQVGNQTKVLILIYNFVDASPEDAKEEKLTLVGTVE